MNEVRVLAYKSANALERRAIQAEAVEAHHDRIAAMARRMAAGPNEADARQAGAIGVLVALEKWNPGKGVPFSAYVGVWIQAEMEQCLGLIRPRVAPGQTTGRKRVARPVDVLPEDDVLNDEKSTTPEQEAAEAELRLRLAVFVSGLSESERALLFCEPGRRRDGSAGRGGLGPNSSDWRSYLILVERATAFVRGSENGHGSSVRRDRDSGSAAA